MTCSARCPLRNTSGTWHSLATTTATPDWRRASPKPQRRSSRHGRGQDANDRLLLPIAYNYRHALELALKQAIRQAAECCQLDGDDDPGLTPQALEAHFKQKQRHRLGPLAQQLAGMLADLNLDELPPDTMHLLQDLHQLDPTGEAFRYEGHLKTSASHVDVTRLVERFRAAFDVIHGGVLAVLDQYAAFLHEMREAYIPG